ncbi:hypothetical protein SAMN04488007_2088 [Maribacter aquivivus]|uniref:Polymer-forming protein n=1 Tax=Maribacter aquivivus TaxID=228958 RepID=A0A1M6PX85_9FLAO|nr:hypothetical protein [Maribacter aquivivus]SHK12501.1 hypothetical protein SAMN04488007_2088 [Maribacter aquivivus]
MIIARKVKAGALQFVLFVGAIVAVLLMSFLLLTYTHQHFEKKTDVLVEVLRSTNYGIESSLKADFQIGDSYAVVKEEDIPITTTVKREFWGVFEKRKALAIHGNTSYTKTVLIGGQEQEELPALYLNNHQRPVIVAGNTRITGNAYLPEQGLKMGNINGNSYNRNELLYGRRFRSDSVLPKLSADLDTQIKLLATSNYIPQGDIIHRLSSEGIKNSFNNETIVYKDRTVRLQNIQLTGNVIIVASSKIIVEASAQLTDVVLMAPEIEIENGVSGTFQAIATESIYVGKKCNLFYPSALVVKKEKSFQGSGLVNNKATVNRPPTIHLNERAKVRGYVMVIDDNTTKQYTPSIKIETGAKVIGEVYCTKNVELKGSVDGTVFTDGFIALENGSVYQNHIYNGIINSTQISDKYVGLLLASRVDNKKVMKWLY